MYLAAHAMGKKWGDKVEGLPLVIKLCKAFAVSTIFVGIITGSIFGLNFDNREWILIDVAVGVGDPMLFFYLALGLGVLHLSFSYLMGMMQAGSWAAKIVETGVAVRFVGRRLSGYPEHLVFRARRGVQPAPDLGRFRRAGAGHSADAFFLQRPQALGGSSRGWACGASTA